MTTNRIERGREIAPTGRATPVRRTSRIPTRPERPTRDVAAPRGSAGLAGCSGRTSRTSTPPSSSASSFAGSPRADARSTRARRSPSAGAERPDPAYPAGRGGGAETGTRASAPPVARRVPETCPFRVPGASAPNAPRRRVSPPEDFLRGPSNTTPPAVVDLPGGLRAVSLPFCP